MVEVKSLLAHQWPLLKSVRLRALANAPEAFSTTLAQALSWSDSDWQERARRFDISPPATARIAYVDGAPCGMISCYSSEPDGQADGPAADLTAVWVDPKGRGQGVGEALVASVVMWANAHDIKTLEAWVMESNRRAIAFYKKVGFQEVGHRRPYEPDPSKHIILLTRRLG